jgi:predicted O-linked N-acetylglucosamine transferase (SPINDLY family)
MAAPPPIVMSDNISKLMARADGLHERGELERAVLAYRDVLRQAPDHAKAYDHLGRALMGCGRIRPARLMMERSIELEPANPECWYNLSGVYLGLGDFPRAVAAGREAVARLPEFPEAWNNLATALRLNGDSAAALIAARRGVEIANHPVAHSRLISSLDADAKTSARAAYAERRRWAEIHAEPLRAGWPDHARHDRDPNRRLRIGYVGGDFRFHSAPCAFGAPLLLGASGNLDVYLYSNSPVEDERTAAFAAAATKFMRVREISDEALAAGIKADKIDILVDLSGHAPNGRLLTFARKPAPVQATAWGDPSGTGVGAIDYLLADPVTLPAAERSYMVEKVWNLPCVMGYSYPWPRPEPIAPLPARETGAVTFGCFNRAGKITPEAVGAWTRILNRLPTARLLLKDQEFDIAGIRRRIMQWFRAAGADMARVIVHGRSEHLLHLSIYDFVDLGLDTFTLGGGITTMEAIWCGVPVITRLGDRVHGRISAAIMHGLELDEFVVESSAAYVDRAVALANDLLYIGALRPTLRQRLLASPFGNEQAYAAAVEHAYRGMWRAFCAGARPAAAADAAE